MLHVILRQGKMSKYQFCVCWDIFLKQMSYKYYKMIESNSEHERDLGQAIKSVDNEDHPCLQSKDKFWQHETENTTFLTESLHLYVLVFECYATLFTYST